jgi:1-acyl-sn-glycerol-3-phosphate acyltransferase
MARDGKAEQGILEELARGVMIVVIVLYTLFGVDISIARIAQEPKRRNNLVILCQFRLTIRT